MNKQLSFSQRLENLRNDVMAGINTKFLGNMDKDNTLDLKKNGADGAFIKIPDYDEYSDTPYLGTHEVISLQYNYCDNLTLVDECEEEFDLADLNIDSLISLYEHIEELYPCK